MGIITLDCESIDSIYQSLENILGISRQMITEFLVTFDMDRYYSLHPNYFDTGDELLLSLLRRQYKVSMEFEATHWFHLTRVHRNTDFTQGILPLSEAVEGVWTLLYALVRFDFSEKQWREFRQHVEFESGNHYARLYNMKVSDPIHWGPYGMLIRDVAFRAEEISNHDYLEIPEIIEDICICFDEIYGYGLREKFIVSTIPCVVKFVSPLAKPYYIGVVLFYLYCYCRKLEIGLYCNTCFDGGGSRIPHGNIIKIDYLDES